MKQGVSIEVRQSVLALRRKHSLREVAGLTDLPLGTVKTLCTRSGEFRDNAALRALCTLPEPRLSGATALTVPTLPPQSQITGDSEIDAVLWLREVIKTGNPDLIAKAMQAAERIKTPLPELEKRYTAHLMAANPGNWTVAFKTVGFDNLKGLATSSTANALKRQDAYARFGDDLFNNTSAESFCVDALAGVEGDRDQWGRIKGDAVDAAFKARPDLLPRTLGDCLHELIYWHDLYSLRYAADSGHMDELPEVSARGDCVKRQLACIRPRGKVEALAVFRHLREYPDSFCNKEADAIVLNLLTG